MADANIFRSLRSAATYSLNDTLLPLAIARNATELLGRREPLDCVRAALRAQSPVAVVALGGSISAGSSYSVRYGGSGAWLYHAKVAHALRADSSAASADLVAHHNGALPATGPAFFEHCVDGQLRFRQPHPSAPRLVLVEFGVNTDGNPAAFERLLRKLLAIRPVLAILVVNMHVWTLKGFYRKCWRGAKRSEVSMTEAEQLDEQTWSDRFNFGDEDAIAALCKHYNVPLVSMRSALLAAVKANRDGKFDPTLAVRYFMIDCKHPSGQGHTYLAQMVLARLLGGGDEGAVLSPAAAILQQQRSCAAASEESQQPTLPPPLHADGLPRGVSQCVNGAHLQHLPGVSSNGFVFTGEGRGKLGWVGRQPGDRISFCVVNSGPRVGNGHAAYRPNGKWKTNGGGGATPRQCVDVGERGSTPAAARLYCRRHRQHCGEHQFPKLIRQCEASCGMCGTTEAGGSSASSSSVSSSSLVGLWVGYLESYEHMGRATVTCDGSCACVPSEIDAHSAPSSGKPRVSITAVRRIALRVHKNESDSCCRLHVKIGSGSSSGEHKFKLLALLLAESSEKDAWQPPGVKVGASWALDMMHQDGNDRGSESAKGKGKGRGL